MFPRYGRKNKKYKVKLPPERMSFEQKVKWQVIISSVLIGLCIGMSFLKNTPKKTVNPYLYNTYSSAQCKKALSPVVKGVSNFSGKAVSLYLDLFLPDSKNESRIVADTPKVKADDIKKEKKTEVRKSESKQPEEFPEAYEEWKWPHQGNISSPYGQRVHPISGQESFHGGIDIAASYGEDVVAVHSGKVEKTGYDDSNGNYVILSHGNDITSVYIHLSEITVNEGEPIASGGIVGKVGATGLATGPHLHFEIKEKGKSVDPAKYILPK